MPLFVKPKTKLTRDAVHDLMSHHFQHTWFDPSTDVGAGAEHSPVRRSRLFDHEAAAAGAWLLSAT
jgi:dipeptidase